MPHERCDVSVIIPAYRAEATIERALSSIAAQTVLPREIIVVDDGSDDETVKRTESRIGKMNGAELIVLRQDHRGPGAARNLALKKAVGTYVAFLDADDEWLPEKLERSLEVMRKTGSVLVSHNFESIDGSKSVTVDCTKRFKAGEDSFKNYFLFGFIATSTVVTRRDILIKSGGFDPGLLSGQDYELWLIVADNNIHNIHVFPDVLTRYHISKLGITSNIELRRRCALRILNRHSGHLRNHPGSPMLTTASRALIIHGQAAQAYVSKRHFGRALLSCLKAFPNTLQAMLGLMKTTQGRPNYLDFKTTT
ncbi:MAG: glycosyltransferase family 2 protein [Rhodospirillales bacterium]